MQEGLKPIFDLLETDVLKKAVYTWGTKIQEDIAIEEMAELTQAILKSRRGRKSNQAEEIADVLITVSQLALNEREMVLQYVNYKMERLKSRLALVDENPNSQEVK